MGENSRKHTMEMVISGDEEHKKAMQDMMDKSQEDQQKWYQNFVDAFDSLEDT